MYFHLQSLGASIEEICPVLYMRRPTVRMHWNCTRTNSRDWGQLDITAAQQLHSATQRLSSYQFNRVHQKQYYSNVLQSCVRYRDLQGYFTLLRTLNPLTLHPLVCVYIEVIVRLFSLSPCYYSLFILLSEAPSRSFHVGIRALRPVTPHSALPFNGLPDVGQDALRYVKNYLFSHLKGIWSM